jgi:hypothetical protein
VELTPGDAHDTPARGLEDAVSFAVALESGASAVCFVAVELDDEALFSPEEVRLDPAAGEVEVPVDGRAGKVVGIEEGEEARFELLAGQDGLHSPLKDLPQRGRSATPAVALE